MSIIQEKSITIYEAMQGIKSGKYIIPAFQRQFIWDLERIEKLWDSILTDYPIATFLYWKLDENNTSNQTYFCDFLQNVEFNKRKQSDSLNYDTKPIDPKFTDTAILDGQQRLTSLYLTLFGEAKVKVNNTKKVDANKDIYQCCIELDKQKVAYNEDDEYNSKTYDIRFLPSTNPTLFRIRDIINPEFENKNTREGRIEKTVVDIFMQTIEREKQIQEIGNSIDTHLPSIEEVLQEKGEYARKILCKLCENIYDNQLIHYTELIDAECEKALEIFIRFNAGGIPLKKSEITMSIIESYWSMARSCFGQVLQKEFSEFGNEFIISVAFMLYKDNYNTNIDAILVNNLQKDWHNFTQVLDDLQELFFELKINITRYSKGRHAILLPIIYCLYNNPDFKYKQNEILAYLTRVLFFNIRINQKELRQKIQEYHYEITLPMLNSMTSYASNDAKIEYVLNANINSRIAIEVLYFTSFQYLNQDSGKVYNYKTNVGYLHHKSKFDIKPPSIGTKLWNAWRKNRELLPNLFLIEYPTPHTQGEQSLREFINHKHREDKQKFYLQNCIPDDAPLGIEKFGDFFNERRRLFKQKIRKLFVGDTSNINSGEITNDDYDIDEQINIENM